MKKYNITTAKVYESGGEQKKAWKNVGQLIRWEATADKPEQFSIELNMFPNEKFYVFEEKPRNNDEI